MPKPSGAEDEAGSEIEELCNDRASASRGAAAGGTQEGSAAQLHERSSRLAEPRVLPQAETARHSKPRRGVRLLCATLGDTLHNLRPVLSVLLVLAGALVLDTTDVKLLSGAMRALEKGLGLSPSDLAWVAMVQVISVALGSPVWGILADRSDRSRVLAVGCFCWGITTAMLGCVSSLRALLFVRFFNGVALSSMNPIGQSLLADVTVPELRGTCFGIYHAIGTLGDMAADVFVPGLSNLTLLGFQGWRVTCFGVAVASSLYALVVLRFLADPRGSAAQKAKAQLSVHEGCQAIFRCKTWLLICCQGVFGAMPYSTFAFLVLWLQYVGFPDVEAGLIVSHKALGALIGTLTAGLMGDWAARCSPNHGRIFIAQAADLLRLPLLSVLFLALPKTGAGAAPYAVTLACLGFLMPFPSIACSRPIFTEVVRPELRGSIIAYQTMVEGSIGSLGAFGVGRLAKVAYHYKTVRQDVASMPDALRSTNARALGHSLAITTTVPWTLCTLLYGLVHFTYKHDRVRAANGQHA